MFGYADRGTGVEKAAQRSAREGWGHFLQEFRWNWFCTLTFRHVLSRERARDCFRDFMVEIQSANHFPLGWFAVEGRGDNLGRFHIHTLLVGVVHLRRGDWQREWYRRGGTATIDEYDPLRGAAYYCANHINEADLEYYWSDNLSAFRLSTRPTTTEQHVEIALDAVGRQRKAQPRLHSEPPVLCKDSSPHCEGANDENEDEQELRCLPSTADPSTGWRDSFGGMNMGQQVTPEKFATEADEKDRQIRSSWAEVTKASGVYKKASILFGKLCEEMRARGLHKYVRKPGSHKGFVSFEEYIHDLTGGRCSNGTLYNSIAIYKITQGPNAVTEEDVAEMPLQNAVLLGRLKPERRTPDVVEAAKTTSKRDFPAKIQEKLNEDLPPEEQMAVRVDFFRKLNPVVAEKLEGTIERFTRLPVVRDGDRGLTLQEKAIYAICNAAEQFASEDLAAVEQRQRGEEPKFLGF
jgi:hypothetical protein